MTVAALSNRSLNKPSSEPTGLFVGLDEAGYGPNLGPLVVSCVTFRGPLSLRDADWWQLLAPTIGRTPPAPFLIDDSKKVLTRKSGVQTLRNTVHAFLQQCGHCSWGLRNLLHALDNEGAEELSQEHWFCEKTDGESAKTAASDSDNGEELLQGMHAVGLELVSVRVRCLFPSLFNRLLIECGNKAAVELQAVRQLLSESLCPAQPEPVIAIVDRLGGRKNYRIALEELAGDAFLQTVQEAKEASEYRFLEEHRETNISFRVKADATCLPVALASMVAKYLRERCMQQFNQYWLEAIDGIRPTAGYPVDAKRFLQEVQPKLAARNISLSQFWRDK